MRKLFVFNPDCELAIAAGGRYYTPPANIVRMIDDLAFLPAWMGEEGDRVLVPKLPDNDFLQGILLPLDCPVEAVTEAQLLPGTGVTAEPWGLSPKMCHWLADRGWGKEWSPEQKELYSRRTARMALLRLGELLPGIETGIVPRICHRLEEIEELVRKGRWMAKAPWSSSGKGLLALHASLGAKECKWLSGVLHKQGYVMVEPFLDKVADFALEFEATDCSMEFMGWSLFTTGRHGEYDGNFVGPQEVIIDRLARLVDRETLFSLPTVVASVLETMLPEYHGYLGVDMMVYLDREGKRRIQPCVEINLRCNMGIVALAFSHRYLAPEVCGRFSVDFYPVPGEALGRHLKQLQEHPPVYKNSRIESGYLPLIPQITETTRFVASICCY